MSSARSMGTKWRHRLLTSKGRPFTPRMLMDFLPNMITILALCAGLASLRYSYLQRFEISVIAILLAAVLDGMDGRIARLLGSTSDFGAELDSLSDFLCFGVAPAFFAYAQFGVGESWHQVLWFFCSFFAVCSALRLARFNVYRLAATRISWGTQFSIGVPAPAGAFIALLPVMAHFSFGLHVSVSFYLVSMGMSGLLMVSRIPTFMFKNIQLSPRRMTLSLLGVTIVSAGLLTTPWSTLFFLGVLYMGSIPLSLLHVRRLKQNTQKKTSPASKKERQIP